ncbi:hypothetical protein A8O14_10235 [Polynucleobacter wuianus]|uniref:ATPase AAA-type core domain-containing protein n=1 Tax=Polynucleobacter wuianus TaxID=1743168 RepID=A0A191UHF9_9BURK|nr:MULTISPECIES: hypothetical protein [Polynucleobacter]ANJ00418.1 hypothetical protein A8O14_10235 [Polynucleobacter wuianus]MBU3552998.1 hypothetical protein [Polynucleobacter sp. MWH-Post4-6-1]
MRVADKHKPKNLDEVIYPNQTVKERIMAHATGGLTGNLMLWGPNGTSKSTVANLLPVAISGENAFVETKSLNVLMDHPQFEEIISKSCLLTTFTDSHQYYIVSHELDNYKIKAHEFWVLMDKYSTQMKVIITTNDPMKVHPSIRSRCTPVHFPAVQPHQVLKRAQYILQQEGVHLTDAAVMHYLSAVQHHGDLRKYFEKLDDLIFLQSKGTPFPPVPTGTQAANRLSVVPVIKKAA